MNQNELKKACIEVKTYSPVEIVENIEEIQSLITVLLMYSGKFKTERTKQKYNKLAVELIELLPEDQSKYDTGSMFTIGRNNEEISAAPIISIYHDPTKKFEIGEMIIDPNDIDDPTIIYNRPKNKKITFDLQTSYNSIYETDQAIYAENQSQNTELKEKEKLQIDQLFQIAIKQGIILEKLLDAYESNLWYDDMKKWDNNKMKTEIAFLREIFMSNSVDITTFGERIAIEGLDQKSNNPDTSAEEILEVCLNIPCIKKEELDMKKINKVFKSFFKKVTKKFKPGTDFLEIVIENDANIRLGFVCDKLEPESDLKYRINYFTQVIQSLQDQGKKITSFTYNWKKMKKKEKKYLESNRTG